MSRVRADETATVTKSDGQWPVEHDRPMADLTAFVLPAVIGLAAMYGATAVTALPGERVTFAVVCVAALALMLRALGQPLPPLARNLTVLWVLFVAVYLSASLLQVAWTPKYVIGDAALGVLPLLVMLAFVARPAWLERRSGLILLLLLLGVSALVARVFGMLGTRHDAPSSMLITGVWYYALTGETRRTRAAAWALVAVVGALCFTSGYRTHLILFAVAPVLIVFFLRGAKATLTTLILAVAAYTLVTLAGVQINLVESFSETRFQAVLAGKPDESLDTRFSELRDVNETMDREWLPGQSVIGYGFGASYQPNRAYIDQNVGSDGRVHNIHIGPALIVFRFGWLGLGIYAAMMVVIVKTLWDVRRGKTGRIHPDLPAVFAVTLLVLSVEFLMLNSTVQPVFSYCLGGLLAARALYRPAVRTSIRLRARSQLVGRSQRP